MWLINPKTGVRKEFKEKAAHYAIREYGWVKEGEFKERELTPAEVENELLKKQIAVLEAERDKEPKPNGTLPEANEEEIEPKKTVKKKK